MSRIQASLYELEPGVLRARFRLSLRLEPHLAAVLDPTLLGAHVTHLHEHRGGDVPRVQRLHVFLAQVLQLPRLTGGAGGVALVLQGGLLVALAPLQLRQRQAAGGQPQVPLPIELQMRARRLPRPFQDTACFGVVVAAVQQRPTPMKQRLRRTGTVALLSGTAIPHREAAGERGRSRAPVLTQELNIGQQAVTLAERRWMGDGRDAPRQRLLGVGQLVAADLVEGGEHVLFAGRRAAEQAQECDYAEEVFAGAIWHGGVSESVLKVVVLPKRWVVERIFA